MTTPTDPELKGLAKLREPFAPHQISKLPKETKAQQEARKNRVANCMVWKCPECGGAHHKDAVHLDYVGHAALTDRLLDCDPRWNWEPAMLEGLPGPGNGMWIKLTVCGVSRLGYGAADGKSGGDAIKEIIGDALRNAAMRFGAALDLWHKGDLHPEEQAGEEGQSQQGAVSPPSPEPEEKQPEPAKGWREPDSPYSTPSKLAAALRNFEREIHGCGDIETLDAFTASQEWKEFVKIADKHAPHYLFGGPPAPEEFEGLITKANRLSDEFQLAVANHMVDVARA